MLEANRSFVAGGAAGDRSMDALREFQRMNPPKFSGQREPLEADHWSVEICRIFDTLGIVEDRQRITFASYHLSGEAVPWRSSIVEMRRSSLAAGEVYPIGTMTWAQFQHLFETQYFPQ